MKKAFLLLTVAVFLFTTGCSLSKPEETPLIAVPSEETAEPDPPASTPSKDSAEPPASSAPDEVGDPPVSKPSDETAEPQNPVPTDPTPETPTADPPQDPAAFPYETALVKPSAWAEPLFPAAVCPSWLWTEPHECIPLPLLRLDNQEELLQLCRSIDTNPHSTDPTLQETTAHCDRSFFEMNNLIVILIHSAGGPFEVQGLDKINGALSFTIGPEDLPQGTLTNAAVSPLLLIVTVPKTEFSENTQVYAHAFTLYPKLV